MLTGSHSLSRLFSCSLAARALVTLRSLGPAAMSGGSWPWTTAQLQDRLPEHPKTVGVCDEFRCRASAHHHHGPDPPTRLVDSWADCSAFFTAFREILGAGLVVATAYPMGQRPRAVDKRWAHA